MNKLYIFFLLLIFLCLIHKPAWASYTFTKYSNNPLQVELGTKYNSLLQSNPFIYDEKFYSILTVQNFSNKYILVLAESGDGLSWTITKELFQSSNNLYAPRLLFENKNQFKLFYTKEESPLKIYFVLCDNSFNCSNSETQVLAPSNNTWDSDTVASGLPYKMNDKYFLFYEGLSAGIWNIGLAYSDDGISWTKCPKPLINNAGGSFLFNSNSDLYLIFHNASNDESKHGVEMVGPVKTLGCDMSWENRQYLIHTGNTYDKTHIIAPSLVANNATLYLYYTGLGSNGWSLNLATASLDQGITPTPTLTNTPTPTPTHTPIVIVPGFLGSWNKDAILHNKAVNQSEWKMNPYVHEYDGILQTLQNLGYQKDKDLFIFPYEWRQKILTSSDELNTFIAEKVNGKVNIVGHSLGGLVGRIFTQKYSEKVDKLITVGSPHQGTVQSYKAIEGGEVDRDNTWLWLSEKTILMLNKSGIEPDRITIQQKIPVLSDLLPTFDYIKTSQNTWLPVNSMQYKNNLLSFYNNKIQEIDTKTSMIAGIGHNTLSGFIIKPVEGIDNIIGNYPDGYPLQNFFEVGDALIPKKSAEINTITNKKEIALNHWQLIADKKGVQAVLQFLNIQAEDEDITAGKLTNITPSLIFLIKSPAFMTVTDPNNQTYAENEGMIFIENPVNGQYSLKVTGTDNGHYSILIGKNGIDDDVWQSIDGDITQNPPSAQTDIYPLTINLNDKSIPISSGKVLLKDLIQYLKHINLDLKSKDIEKSIEHLQKALQNYDGKNNLQVKINLIAAQSELLQAFKRNSNDDQIFSGIEKLEALYPVVLKSYKFDLVKHLLSRLNAEARKELKEQEKYLQKNKNKIPNAVILKQIDNRIKLVDADLENNNLLEAEILLETIHGLLKTTYIHM